MMRIKMKLLFSLTLMYLTGSLFAEFDLDYVFDDKWNYFWLPKAYTVESSHTYFGPEVGLLNGAEDIFVDSSGKIYIVDTGNDRIVRLNADMTADGVFHGPADSPMKGPKGIFVDEDGDMYVADTQNGRILHLGPEGEYVEEFVKPESALFSDEYPFKPTKVAIDSIGFMFILNQDDYHGFITMDSYNRFRGYLAPTRLEFSLKQVLIRNFASKEQRDRLSRELPPYHSNFFIGGDGAMYTTTVFTDHDQLKKINAVGNNTYTGKILELQEIFGIDIDSHSYFGEKLSDDQTVQITPMFIDITVDEKGIITAIDSTTQRIYQYDQEGRLLAVFGGSGDVEGRFKSLSSITVLEGGRLAVLDKELNTLQVFAPNRFISLVHEAVELQYAGKYDEAFAPWQKVISINPNYNIALSSMAKLSYKQEDWRKSVDLYRKAEDKVGYSEAFLEYRKSLFRDNFFLSVVLILAVFFLVVKLVSLAKRRADKTLTHMIKGTGH